MTFVLLTITYTLGSLYLISVLIFGIGLFRIRSTPRRASTKSLSPSLSPARNAPFVSVLVAARNEASFIPNCLKALLSQTYPPDRYEIIWIDDQSTDESRAIVQRHTNTAANLRPLWTTDATEGVPLTGKQTALDLGIRQSRGEIILTTDADCVVPPTWISEVVREFQPDVGMVVGFSILTPTLPPRSLWKRLFLNLQACELLAIFSLYAGCLRVGVAFACTGNNLAYRREVYQELGGFKALGYTVAEDNMLLQAVQRQTDWRIVPLCRPGSVVQARPTESVRAFLKQRSRWGSNNLENRPSLILFMFIIYFFYAGLMSMTTFTLLGVYRWEWVAVAWGLKILPELILVSRGFWLFQRGDLLKFFPLAPPLQATYILICVLVGMLGRNDWKGRDA